MLSGDDGNDWEHGGNGDDLMYGGAGDDKFYGGDGNDLLSGDTGNDYLETGLGRAVLLGGAGDDQLFGGDSNDVLIGGSGKDSLLGHGGDDLLIGGSTDYDNNSATMTWVLAAWSNGTYDARVQTITDALFTADVVDGDDPAMHSTAAGGHLIDDQVSDSLSGEGGQDWFLESGYMPMWLPSDVNSELQANVDSAVLCGEQVMYLTNHVPSIEGFNLFDSLDTLSDRQTSETLTSLVPKADSVSLEKEHLALMQLVRYDQVTNYAIRSGDWSDPTIWHGGVVPASGARVLIPVGVEINVDAMIPARLSTVRVDGTLSFDTAHNSQLQVDTLVVSDCGEFEMGTAEDPIARGVTARLFITDNGAIDRNWDPYGISRGLIAQGAVSIFGSQVDSYSALAGSVAAGTQALSLATVPVGWKVGDSIVIAATAPGTTQDETRLITAIAGNLVQLDRPLSYGHTAPSGSFQINVANLTRNAVVESEASSADRNGHVMFMHSRDVNISYGGFYQLGRTDKSKPINDPVIQSDWTLKPGTGTNPRARYAVHFHRAGVDDASDPAVITGSVVDGGPGWGFVNHSSNVDMIGNVAYGVNGAAFVSEVGDEIGGFYSNLAIGTTGTNEEPDAREGIQDFGFGGDGFWFQGAGVSVVGNISAGNQGDAFAYYTRGLFQGQFLTKNLLDPSIAKGAPSIPVGQVPIREFSGNVGYASNVSLRLRYHLQDVTQGQRSLVANSKFWNNTTGMWLDYDQNTTYRNVTLTTTQFQMLGIRGGGQTTNNLTFENLDVSGYYGGIDMPRRGTSTIIGGSFNNINYDIRLFNAIVNDRFITINGLTGQPKIRSDYDMTPIPGYPATSAFVNDVVLLNFGQFVNQRLYSALQTATAVPFGTARVDLPSQYVGLTNQQLWNEFGKAFGGAIAPSNAITAPNIVGLIAPKV
jgi:Ca2+-binding RTX toxin-like protein